jgi:hypothetical protein
MNQPMGPDQTADFFFRSLMQNQCHVCWSLFSSKSQEHFLKWTLEALAQKNPTAVTASKIGPKEVRILLERNDSLLIKTFWKHFFLSSSAADFFRFGYYNVQENNGREAKVLVTFKYPNGQSAQVTVTMLKERGGWKFAYIESELPF